MWWEFNVNPHTVNKNRMNKEWGPKVTHFLNNRWIILQSSVSSFDKLLAICTIFTAH